MNITMDNLTASIATLIITLSAGVVPSVQLFWFIPVIGGVVAVIGLFLERTTFMDIGVLFSIISFLVIHRLTIFTFTNMILVLVMFFLLLTMMIVNRRSLTLTRLKKDMAGEERPQTYREYELESIMAIGFTSLTAFVVSMIGGLIAVYSSLDIDLSPDHAVIFVLSLAVIFMFVIYLISEIIPRYTE